MLCTFQVPRVQIPHSTPQKAPNRVLFYYQWDLNPKWALSVKQNNMDYCFVVKRSEVGYRTPLVLGRQAVMIF